MLPVLLCILLLQYEHLQRTTCIKRWKTVIVYQSSSAFQFTNVTGNHEKEARNIVHFILSSVIPCFLKCLIRDVTEFWYTMCRKILIMFIYFIIMFILCYYEYFCHLCKWLWIKPLEKYCEYEQIQYVDAVLLSRAWAKRASQLHHLEKIFGWISTF